MDAVLFSVKRAHLAGERFGRRWLKPFGLTPARFDLLNVAAGGVRQSELWRRLGVVRSAVCEMLVALESIGLVTRSRDWHDARTWWVTLTERGAEIFRRAHAELVDSGDVAVTLDAVLAHGAPEVNLERVRYDFAQHCFGLVGAFGMGVDVDVYWWDIECFYHAFLGDDEELAS